MLEKMVVVGTGHAWGKFYRQTVTDLKMKLLGTVDPAVEDGNADGGWRVRTVQDIPEDAIANDVVVMVLTPDHYPVIAELAGRGFKNILCEKPLVSRASEIEKLEELVKTHELKLYAIDFYLPKTFGLQVALGLVRQDDPRREWVASSDPEADGQAMLGDIEGVGVQVLEAGDFCLPDIASRPYLANDKEIGGMTLDLITHACGPLHQARLLDEWRVLATSLSRLSAVTSGHLVPVADTSTEVEMYVTALLEANGVPVHLVFGKVPIAKGGLWAIEIRGKKGMFFSGLRTGQPAVLVGNDGKVVTFSLNMTTYEFVVREALLYFSGSLPGFDGNYRAFLTSIEVGRAILAKYGEW